MSNKLARLRDDKPDRAPDVQSKGSGDLLDCQLWFGEDGCLGFGNEDEDWQYYTHARIDGKSMTPEEYFNYVISKDTHNHKLAFAGYILEKNLFEESSDE